MSVSAGISHGAEERCVTVMNRLLALCAILRANPMGHPEYPALFEAILSAFSSVLTTLCRCPCFRMGHDRYAWEEFKKEGE